MSVQRSSDSKAPVMILKEGSTLRTGKDAQKDNVAAAKIIAEIVKVTLGPRGMDKMLVDAVGEVTITNDGATILKEIDVQHPAAKMMVEVAKSVDNEVGDGTTSSVILAGALIEKAEELMLKDVHPTVIVDGYGKSAAKAIEILNNISQKIDVQDKAQLVKIAKTSMQTKLISQEMYKVAHIVVNAIFHVAEKTSEGDGFRVDLDDIKVEKKAGGSLADTKLIKGIVLDKEVVGGMPKRIERAKIALINIALEIGSTDMSAEFRNNDPQQMQTFREEENKMLKSMVEKIKRSGANVIVCQKGINDIAQYYFSNASIIAVRKVKESDMARLARATGARRVNNLEDLTAKDLGSADLVEERKVETDKWIFVEGCKNPKSVTILIRGGSQRVVDEADRSVHDALMVVKDVFEKPAIVAGGGAPESYIAGKIREWANNLVGREQLSAEKFAEALEVIPLTLAENAGMDPIDTMTDLRAKQSKRGAWIGVDARNTTITDMSKLDIVEPVKVKEQIIKSATEAASMILRISDVIGVPKSPAVGPISQTVPPDVGGMGGMTGSEEIDARSPKKIQSDQSSIPEIRPILSSPLTEVANESHSQEIPSNQGIKNHRVENIVEREGALSMINNITNRQDLNDFDSARRMAIENMKSKPEAFQYYLVQNRKYLLRSLDNIMQGIVDSVKTATKLSDDQHTILMFLTHLKDRIKGDDKRDLEDLKNEFFHFKNQAVEISSKILPRFVD